MSQPDDTETMSRYERQMMASTDVIERLSRENAKLVQALNMIADRCQIAGMSFESQSYVNTETALAALAAATQAFHAQGRRCEVSPCGYVSTEISPRFMELWREIEILKNKHQGHVPTPPIKEANEI